VSLLTSRGLIAPDRLERVNHQPASMPLRDPLSVEVFMSRNDEESATPAAGAHVVRERAGDDVAALGVSAFADELEIAVALRRIEMDALVDRSKAFLVLRFAEKPTGIRHAAAYLIRNE